MVDWFKGFLLRSPRPPRHKYVFAHTARAAGEEDSWVFPNQPAFPDAVLCQKCTHYLTTFDREDPHRDERPLHETFASFQAAVLSGCQLCSELWHQHTPAQLDYLARRREHRWPEGVVEISMIAPRAVEGPDNRDEHFIDISTNPPTPDRRGVRSRFELHSISGHGNCFLDYQLGQRTSARSCLELVRTWYLECVKYHHRCNVTRPKSYRGPARLIDIRRTKASDWRLYQVPHGKAREIKYLTLSHCWGRASFLTLTTSSFSGMVAGMLMEALPKTFRDAIEVARYLRFDYIWIDSLCITQDSVDDWAKESAYMQEIYRYSSITIAATAADNGDRGCFVDRDPRTTLPNKVAIRWADRVVEHDYFLLNQDYFPRQLTQAPLNRRAWVVQERILSPRTLHFGQTQIFWECSETHACEAFPRELPRRAVSSEAWIAQYCTSRLDGIDSVDTRETVTERRQDLHSIWSRLVSMYARCALTNSGDKLVALSGLATRFAEALKDDKYLAGLWQEDLPHNLLWSVLDPKRQGGVEPVKPASYRAPSWSWASIDAPISTERRYSPANGTVLIDLQEVWTRPVSNNVTGQVNDGLLRIQGRLVQADFDRDDKRKLRTERRSFNADVAFDFPTAAAGIERSFFIVPIRMYLAQRTEGNDQDHEWVQGLVLRQSVDRGCENEAKYERVGYWEASTFYNEERLVGAECILPGQLCTIWEDSPITTIDVI